ncbi:hypothetical protein RQP46_008736 [Phenoliferia psychrophenolica]
MSTAIVIPKVCKAAVVRNPGPDYTLETIEDCPVPVPGPGQLLLRLNVTGLCSAGAVVALGPGVDPEVWKIGDRAGIKPFWDVCHDGSYCEYIVSPARYTSRIPDGLADEIAGPIMCSGSTMYAALRASKAQAGEWVVIPGGGGGVGHMGTQYGKALGLRILAIDTSDEKREMCLSLGAEAFIDFKTCPDVAEEVKRITGGGAHGVIVTGGTASAYASAPYFLRKGGVQVCVGLPPVGTAMAGMDPFFLIFLKLTITGSLVAGQQHVKEALDLAARGFIKPKITVLPFKKFPEGMKMLVKSEVAGRIVINYNL